MSHPSRADWQCASAGPSLGLASAAAHQRLLRKGAHPLTRFEAGAANFDKAARPAPTSQETLRPFSIMGFSSSTSGAEKYEEAATAAAHQLLPASALRAWVSSVSLRSVVSLLRRRTSTAYAMAAVGVVPSASHVIELANAGHNSARVLLLNRVPSCGHQRLD